MNRLIVIFAISLSACVQRGDSPILEPMSDEELTAKSTLVVEAVLETSEIIEYRNDPNLPQDWQADQQLRRFVEGGARREKLDLRVERWLKGTSSEQIIATKPASYEDEREAFGVYAEASDEGLPDFRVGMTYRFWLRADPVFDKEFILIMARVP